MSQSGQGDSWSIGGKQVPYALASLYAEARHRVLSSRQLRDHYEMIMSDASEEHLVWVCRAKVKEIADWATKTPCPETEGRSSC
jgi:hypothetical protein